MKKTIMIITLLLVTITTFAQVSGTVSDASGAVLGANVLVKGTTNGTVTDFDGKFTIKNVDSGIVVVSYVGYNTKEVAFKKGDNVKITLTENTALEAIVIIGSGVIDLAKDRNTPIAVSTIKAREIQEKAGTSDLPELLKSTPSVQNVQRGGFGDGRLYLRGFDQTNTAFLLNGQPINGMEDGKMYWSNWSGVLDVANAVQVQRGLGSSKLAISSVGGTVNIVTKTVDKKQGGFFKTMVGNEQYLKSAAYYSTGLMKNGLAVSAMLGHWQGDGYMQGARGQGQSYFLSFGYKPNEKHIFNFLVTGAPQWHGAAGGSKLKNYLEKGRRYSDWWGYYKGEQYSGGRNFYHKPVINLSWDWKLNETSKLSTVAYASFGRGGFAYPQGSGFYGFRDANGLLDYDAIEADNIATGGDKFVKASINSHNWFGVITNYEKKINENITVNVGADGRFYTGIHYRTATDLLGATVNITNNYSGSYTLTNEVGFNPWDNLFSTTDHKDRFSYDYQEKINYIGAFGQIEYSKDKVAAFFQGAVSNQSHQKTDYWNFATAEDSDKINNLGYNLKLGGAYRINNNNKVFVNTGYYSRQAFHDDLFANIRQSNVLDPNGNKNQDIIGLEAGYKFKSRRVSANLNVYNTIWDNRVLHSAADTDDNGVADEFSVSSGVKETHRGVELEVFTKPIDKLKLNAYASIGDWFYDGDVTVKTYDDNGGSETISDKYIDGTKIGSAAQFTAGVNAKYTIRKNFSMDASYNYYNKLYADINLNSSEFDTASNRGSIELPSYGLIDGGLSYKHPMGKDGKQSIALRLNVNNIFDEFYLENSKTSKFAEDDTSKDTWSGVRTDNRVYVGYGRTWNFGIQVNF